jgi:hypothetical protein
MWCLFPSLPVNPPPQHPLQVVVAGGLLPGIHIKCGRLLPYSATYGLLELAVPELELERGLSFPIS